MFSHHQSNFCAQRTVKLRRCIEKVQNSVARKLRGWCIEKVLMESNNIQSVYSYCDDAEREKSEKFSALNFSPFSADRTHSLPFLYPGSLRRGEFRTLLRQQQAAANRWSRNLYWEADEARNLVHPQVVGIFSGVKRASFFLHRRTFVSVVCAKFEAPRRFVCLAND